MLQPLDLFGSYQIETQLGEGSMAWVFLAYYLPTNEWRVLKILRGHFCNNQQMVSQLMWEGTVLSLLQHGEGHPSIIRIREQGSAQGYPYLALEYLPGSTLRDLLRWYTRLPEHYCVELAAQVAEALAYAHDVHGVLHGDIKPENVFVTPLDKPTWVAKVLDFGLARSTLSQWGTDANTPNPVVGTLDYMAPELLQGRLDIDGCMDVYSLGVVLFEMLTGELPYQATTADEMSYLHAERAPRALIDLLPSPHPLLDRVLTRALARDPTARWPSMTHFAAALRALQQRDE